LQLNRVPSIHRAACPATGWKKNVDESSTKRRFWPAGGRQKSFVGPTEVIQSDRRASSNAFMWLSGLRPACVPFSRVWPCFKESTGPDFCDSERETRDVRQQATSARTA
jgi:hypothetical protein